MRVGDIAQRVLRGLEDHIQKTC